ncbi:cytochrome c oxidase assembly protein [Micrococcus sp.]|uniref:cytochrome c oxidase assembly protein n=1 Tax=Micrococcus sp. TaxID=1271 RepID=UPI002A919BE6|nr:cytochrome c oxidase assembly protein [Micrococcus sp.]MDY6054886.1 cytochrome c oxidase assembly protein [Micrococcus sp.]
MPATSATTPRPGRGTATPSYSRGSEAAARRGVPAWVGVAAAVVGVLALVLAAWVTGITAPRALSEPGALTRWGVPVATFVSHTAMSLTIGALLLAAGVVPPRVGRAEDAAEHPAFRRALNTAAVSAGVWTVAALTVGVLSYSDLAGIPVSAGPDFGAGLMAYARDISVGRAWFWITVIAAVVTTLAVAVRGALGLFWTGVLAMLGILPLALIGHGAGGEDHFGAVSSIGLHLLGVVTWVGGLLALAVLSGVLSRRDAPVRASAGRPSTGRRGTPEVPLVQAVVRRYSVLAGLGLTTVVLSGAVNAWIRMEDPGQLLSPYGTLVLVKAGAVAALGAIGLTHRRWIIPRLDGGPGARRLLWQLVAVEAVLMTAVMGVSAVLARTAPPRSEELAPDATPARILTGYDLPPEPTPERWLTLWRPDWLWVAIIVFLAVWYVGAAVRLHRRGDRWPVLRTVCWLVGLAVLAWVTSGAPAIYGMVLFSAHMVGHMTLTMVAPLFLVLGAPITLALRSLPVRTDGSRGPREWILWIVHSWWGAFVTHPIVAGVHFAGAILVFYYTDVFRFALSEHVGHEFMNFHFLLTGFVFALVMVGADPLPRRPPYPLRLVLLLATMVFHAFIGVALTGSTGVLQASWFGNMGRDWGPSALADQRIGGAIMWGIGEFPTVLMAVAVAVLWYRSDQRVARRMDRKADRDGDADLARWNEMYAALHEPVPARAAGTAAPVSSGTTTPAAAAADRPAPPSGEPAPTPPSDPTSPSDPTFPEPPRER